MDVDLVRALIAATVASSVAILFIALLRRPLRAAMGARAAYWLWFLVPALTLATSIPAPSRILASSAKSVVGRAGAAIVNASLTPSMPDASSIYVAGGLAAWGVGACVMFAFLIRRQRRYVASLGKLTSDGAGLSRSPAIAAPMLLGAWRPIIVVPADFEVRYSSEERALVLAHERAHLRRHDGAVNAIATLWLCLFWFNPLAYWAIRKIRVDQELACDAYVLARREGATRRYADTLLKAQIAAQSGWHPPVGCHWQSAHPLKERIAMLKRPLPGALRRSVGVACICAVTATASYAVWAAQPAGDKGPEILVTLKLTVEDSQSQAKDTYVAATQYIVYSGQTPPGLETGRPYEMTCTTYLADMAVPKMRFPKGQLLIECRVRNNGELVFTPSAVVNDGMPVTLTYLDGDGKPKYTLVARASTSATDIEAAAKAAKKD